MVRNIKEGEVVWIRGQNTLTEVDKVTKNYLILKNGKRKYNFDGTRRGRVNKYNFKNTGGYPEDKYVDGKIYWTKFDTRTDYEKEMSLKRTAIINDMYELIEYLSDDKINELYNVVVKRRSSNYSRYFKNH